jgi:hypothetical protein
MPKLGSVVSCTLGDNFNFKLVSLRWGQGFHRDKADKNWEKIRLEHIDSEEKQK